MINTYTALINPYDIYGYCYYADYENPNGETPEVTPSKYQY